MKVYRVYEAYRNAVGGLDSCGCGWEFIEAVSAEAAARQYWDQEYGCDDPTEGTVIVATDDDTDSFHFSPLQ